MKGWPFGATSQGLEGFDICESRTRNADGQGFDSPQVHVDEEITITMKVSEWSDVLVDIDAFEGEMMDNDFTYHSLEGGTEALRGLLREEGLHI